MPIETPFEVQSIVAVSTVLTSSTSLAVAVKVIVAPEAGVSPSDGLEIVTVGGLPQALATGEADTTNRATLNRLESLAKLSLKDIVRSTVASIEKQIIIPVAKSNGIPPVKIQWGEILIEELDDKSKRLSTYVQAGLLTPDENLEKLVRLIENLPERVIRETGDVDKGTKIKD